VCVCVCACVCVCVCMCVCAREHACVCVLENPENAASIYTCIHMHVDIFNKVDVINIKVREPEDLSPFCGAKIVCMYTFMYMSCAGGNTSTDRTETETPKHQRQRHPHISLDFIGRIFERVRTCSMHVPLIHGGQDP